MRKRQRDYRKRNSEEMIEAELTAHCSKCGQLLLMGSGIYEITDLG